MIKYPLQERKKAEKEMIVGMRREIEGGTLKQLYIPPQVPN